MKLNPDAVIAPGWTELIRAAWGRTPGGVDGAGADRWPRLDQHRDGVLHLTRLGWASQIGHPAASASRSPAGVGFLSGACLVVSPMTWTNTDGLPARFFTCARMIAASCLGCCGC